MAILYRGMDRAALDAAYNNSAAVKNSTEIVAGWQRRSDALRNLYKDSLDLRYGERQRNRVDLFEAAPGAPLLVFIHGGYWQMRAKEHFGFAAAGPLAHGISVAIVGYTLAPDIRLDGIVAEVLAALDFLQGKGKKDIVLSGWSAGAQLTAMALGHPAVKGAVAISGIYDLEPMLHCYLNDKLRLDEAEAGRNSPLLHVATSPGKPLEIAYGTSELPELQRQSREYWTARNKAGLPGAITPLAGHDHFTIMDELARPDGALTSLVRTLLGK